MLEDTAGICRVLFAYGTVDLTQRNQWADHCKELFWIIDTPCKTAAFWLLRRKADEIVSLLSLLNQTVMKTIWSSQYDVNGCSFTRH